MVSSQRYIIDGSDYQDMFVPLTVLSNPEMN